MMQIKNTLVVLLAAFFLSTVACAQPKLIGSYENARLYQENGIYIVDVHGSFEQMGQQYGHLLKKPLHDFYQSYSSNLKMNGFARNLVLWLREKTLPQEEKDFLKGLAETSGLTITNLMMLDHSVQMIYVAEEAQKIGFGCSTLCAVGPATKNGNMIIARNFDWLNNFRSIMTPYLTVAIFHPNKGNAFATIGYIGSSLSAVTAMNDKGLYIELNSAISSVGPYIRFDRPSYFAQMMQMMQNSNNFAQLQKAVLTTAPDEAYTLTIADAHQSASIEVSSAPFLKEFARERTDTTKTVYAADGKNTGIVIATNSYRAKGWKDTFFAKAYPTYTTTQSFERYDNLDKWAIQYQGKITPELAQQILSTPVSQGGVSQTLGTTISTNTSLTYYSIVAIPAMLEWQIHAGESHYPWTTILLGPYFTSGA